MLTSITASMWNFRVLFTIAFFSASNAFHLNSTHANVVVSDSCKTLQDEWKCCETSPKIGKFQITACVDLKLLRESKGMELSITFNNHTIIDEVISATNPPPICTEVPYLDDIVAVCVKFYNLDWEKQTLSGCLALEMELVVLKVLHLKVGCFKFPLPIHELEKQFVMELFKNNNNMIQAL